MKASEARKLTETVKTREEDKLATWTQEAPLTAQKIFDTEVVFGIKKLADVGLTSYRWKGECSDTENPDGKAMVALLENLGYTVKPTLRFRKGGPWIWIYW